MNWIQFRTLLWLRWRLTVNQWRHNNQIGAVFTVILLIIFLGLAAGGGFAGLIGGSMVLAEAPPKIMMFVWDVLVFAFLMLWALGIILEVQRSEMIDQSRLMHLPISPWDAFVLNYLASHLNFSLALLFPGMLGLTVGLALGRGPAMLLLLLLVFCFFFMITAWTYCLRGWLASLMVNKRRRRAIIMGITLAFVLIFQLPNLVMRPVSPHQPSSSSPQTITDQEQKRLRMEEMARKIHVFEQVHRYVPILWLPQGARALEQGNVWPVIWGGLGMFGLGVWGLARAYRMMLRFYRGDMDNKSAPSPSGTKRTARGGKLFVERTFPAVPEEAAGMAFANLRAMARAPEVKMALVINVVIFAVIGSGFLMRKTGGIPEAAEPFIAMGAVLLTFMGLSQLMFNHFGFDRNGFGALVLSPASRRNILLGKNLALLPVACVLFAVFLGLTRVLLHLRVTTILASGLGFCGGFPTVSALGNFISISMPHRVEAGTLKPTKVKGLTQLLIAVIHILLPLAMLPLFVPVGLGWMCDHFNWLPGVVVMLAGAALLALVSVLVYRRTLGPLGNLLQRREQRILQVVTQEVE